MLEKILQNVVMEMMPYLDQEQQDHLSNVLYVNFHGKQIVEECADLVETGMDGNELKVQMFVASKLAVNVQKSTLRQYSREIHNMLRFFGGKRIEDITGMDLRYYYGIMRERRGIKMVTMQTRVHYLSSFWEFLTTEELVHSNPVKKLGRLKVEKVIKKPFSPSELERMRDSCENLRDRALVEFLYASGVRVSELVSLNVRDVDLAKQELIVYGKGSKERKAYITDTAKHHLVRYLEERGARLDEPLFGTRDYRHQRLTVPGVQFTLRTLGIRAGVTNVHPHRFRRTIATDLLNRGMSIEQASRFLGHEKLDTTMIYCTVKDESVKAAYRKCA